MRRKVGRGDATASLALVVSLGGLVLIPSPALGATEVPGVGGYLVRLLLGAVLLGGLLLSLSRISRAAWFRRRFPISGRCRLLGTLPLGRDCLYVILCGPEVIAVVSGRGGIVVVGRWERSRWEEVLDSDEA